MADSIAEQAYGAVLQRPVEVDQRVATGDQLYLGKYGVGRKAVIGKDDVILQRFVKNRAAISGSVVIGERRTGARFVMVGREARDALHVIDPRRGLLQCSRIDVGRIDDRFGQQALRRRPTL